jgi:hypothetical protein
VTLLVRLGKTRGAAAAVVSGRVGVPPAGSGILPERTSGKTVQTGDAQPAAEDRLGETPKPAGGTPTLPGRRSAAIYFYAVLHHPDCRERYAENLKRELPRIPLVTAAEEDRITPFSAERRNPVNPENPVNPVPKKSATFHAFAEAGCKLADLRVGEALQAQAH